MLTVARSVPLLEGLELAVKDDELPSSAASSSLNHHRHMGISRFRFTIAACQVLIGCRIGIIRRRFGCKNSRPAASLKREHLVNQNYYKFQSKPLAFLL